MLIRIETSSTFQKVLASLPQAGVGAPLCWFWQLFFNPATCKQWVATGTFLLLLSFLGWGNFFLKPITLYGWWPEDTACTQKLQHHSLVSYVLWSFFLSRVCNILPLEYGLLLVLILVKVNSRRHSLRYVHSARGLDSCVCRCRRLPGTGENQALVQLSMGKPDKHFVMVFVPFVHYSTLHLCGESIC